MTAKRLDRRTFFRSTAAAAMAPTLGTAAHARAATPSDPAQFMEPAHAVPVKEEVDVVVCGGGPAGVAAAITAARSGARTRLIELQGCLGGIWTCGLLTWIFDFDKPGITQEIMRRLNERNARGRYRDTGVDKDFTYVPEQMKLLLEEMCLEAGVQLRLHTRVTGAYREGKRLTTVVTESKSGREAWRAKVFIDTTGDGDLGALAGNRWETGLGEGQKGCPCQPMTLNALGIVKDAAAIREFISFYEYEDEGKIRYGKHHSKASARLLAELHRAGVDPSYGRPSIFQIKRNLVLLMLNHEYNIPAFDADAITEATVRARAEIHTLVRALNSLGGPWEGMQMAASAEHIGVRDGRRLAGRYRVTEEDLRVGTNHGDGIVTPTFNVDIHATDKKRNDTEGPISHQKFKMQPYQIPLRALIAADVDGLMMAGRCISGDYISHGSYRVTGDAVAMGEGAGVVAAIAAQSKRLPHEVEWAEGVKKLAEIGQRS